MQAEIVIVECPGDPWLDRVMFGRFFWSVYASAFISKSGFARSRGSAHKRAQKAARSLAGKPLARQTRYAYTVED